MSKSWKKKLSNLLKENGNNLLSVNKYLDVEQFIEDIRRKDEAELCKKLNEKKLEQLIKDYYNN